MKAILLLLSLCTINVISTCHVIDPLINITASDFKSHNNQSYEYWWHMGVLNTSVGQFGYLYGVDRCSINCNTHSYLSTISISDRTNNDFHYNNIYYENQDVDIQFTETQNNINNYNVIRHNGIFNLYGKLKTNTNFIGLNLKLKDSKGFVQVNGIKEDKINFVHSIYPLLESTGTIKINNTEHSVNGIGFIDHYWSNNNCANIQTTKWKWFFLQFNNNIQVLLHYIQSSNYKILNIIHINNTVEYLNDFEIIVIKEWTSPKSHIIYPIINRVLADNIDIVVTPLIDDNEFFLFNMPVFYEGLSTVNGYYNNERVSGTGTVELKGFHNK